jgi:hypothetical protein
MQACGGFVTRPCETHMNMASTPGDRMMMMTMMMIF